MITTSAQTTNGLTDAELRATPVDVADGGGSLTVDATNLDIRDLANATDPVLNGIEWEVRRKTLLATREQRAGEVVYRFDIRIQDTPDGGKETVFFDV
jgi:protocatechuate 3,4-dioxygenase beta subunit